MQPSHHGPLPNIYVLVSILGLFLSFFVWQASPSWGFLLLVVFIIVFLASFVSAVRAPMESDHDMELAIHERYKKAGRYPDTDLHHGMIPTKKVYLNTPRRRALVALHKAEQKKAPAPKGKPKKK